jgi:beta-lactam-binding protein with PASTA domain
MLMPNVVGLDYYAAELALLQAGIFVRPGYFEVSKITTSFGRVDPFGFAFGQSAFGIGPFTGPPLPGTVIAQSPLPGAQVAKGAPLNLTLAEFPMSVCFP